jgi:hypothetical protein
MSIRLAFAAVAALALYISPAAAQYYGGDEYDRPMHRGHYGDWRRPRLGYICETTRGSCLHRHPAPFHSSCACTVPGFGVKHGEING